LSGVDAYDLMDGLMALRKFELAKKIISKIQFKWKMRKKYLRAKFIG
jgi:hypothetical protein